MATRLGIYELLTPQFLLGFTFIEEVDRYLSVLGVDTLHTAFDDTTIVYSGTMSFGGELGNLPKLSYRAPGGALIEAEDSELAFRLTVPRNPASNDFQTAMTWLNTNAGGIGLEDTDIAVNLTQLMQVMGGQAAAAPNTTDAYSHGFRLELMVSTLSFELGESWLPGKFEDHRLVADNSHPAQKVRFILPKMIIEYEQGPDLSTGPPDIRLKSWGHAGFDGPADPAMGELIRMEPEIAVHESGRFGFGIGQVILDLSQDATPPEILAHFGTDEAWTGLYIENVRVYYADEGKDFAFTIGVNDVLISFDGEVSLEAFVHLLGNELDFRFDVLFFHGATPIGYPSGQASETKSQVVAGNAVVPDNAHVQLSITGGIPEFTPDFKYIADGNTIDLNSSWNTTLQRMQLPPGLPPSGLLEISLSDDHPNGAQTVYRKIELVLTKPGSQVIPGATRPATAVWTQTSNDPVHRVDHVGSRGYVEMFHITSLNNPLTEGGTVEVLDLTNNNTETRTLAGNDFTITTPKNANFQVTVNLNQAASSQDLTEYFDLRFLYDRPHGTEWEGIKQDYVTNFEHAPHKRDPEYLKSEVPEPARGIGPANPSDSDALVGTKAVHAWLKHRLKVGPGNEKHIQVTAYASYERHDDADVVDYNKRLAIRRLKTAYAVIDDYNARVQNGEYGPGEAEVVIDNRVANPETASDLELKDVVFGQEKAQKGDIIHGDDPGKVETDPRDYPPGSIKGQERYRNVYDRVAVLEGLVAAQVNPAQITGTLTRGEDVVPQIPVLPPPPPFPPARKKPDFFRRVSLRIRIERNVLTLVEVSGEVNFETAMERSMRNGIDPNMQALRQNPDDGAVEFLLSVGFDTATRFLTENLQLHAAQGDTDGIVPPLSSVDGSNTTYNTLGSMMILGPILSEVTGASGSDDPADWGAMAVSWGVPAAIGALGVVKVLRILLYGGELKARQYVPQQGNAQQSDLALLFDYAVEFHLDLLGIVSTTKPLRVRYKSVGFNMHTAIDTNDETVFQPIFDPSKGYEIDLGDPSLLSPPGPLGDLIRVAAARIARYNPLTLEFELAVNLDLGVITIDRFKVKWPISPLGVPTILPAGVKVDLPATLQGSGHLHIGDNGFAGALDVTLVPIKVRIAAALRVERFDDLTAVLATLTVQFPSPIVLGATGLGIYGFSGLFAMHFKRIEQAPQPQDPVGPALGWLIRADGDPTKIVDGNGQDLWAPEADRWSFGIGVILGTLDGGYLDNLQGMFMLELPGPRILICVKMRLLDMLPEMSETTELNMGLLGILDLDFNLGRITIGVLLDFGADELLRITIPVELFFNLKDASDWHLYIGTHLSPASATILGIVRGSGYFMIAGNGIQDWPAGYDHDLGGLSVAGGVAVSLIFGSKDWGLYLEVSVRFDVGVAFSPFFMAGLFMFRGELVLWIISIEVSAELFMRLPPVYAEGEVCGKVDFFFFEIEGCVSVTLGDPGAVEDLPDMVTNAFLQSYAPVIASGQGDRPIDGSLGDALAGNALGTFTGQLIEVPINAIPVLQMTASPLVGASSENWSHDDAPVTTFTEAIKIAPGMSDATGLVIRGEKRYRFRLTKLELHVKPPGESWQPAVFDETPPSVWRLDHDGGNENGNAKIDLALGTRIPTTASYALERSTELTTNVTRTWSRICDIVAQPTRVLWTFCKVPLGTSGHGWHLTGKALPDPPGTLRESGPNLKITIEEPEFSDDEKKLIDIARELGDPFLAPAMVLGEENVETPCFRALHIPRILKHKTTSIDFEPPSDYQEQLDRLLDRTWIRIHTGSCRQVRLRLAASRFWRKGMFEIRQLDAQKNPIVTIPLTQVAQHVLTLSDLPATWSEPTLPWDEDVIPVEQYLSHGEPEYIQLEQLFVELEPKEACVTLELRVLPHRAFFNQPYTLLLGDVETYTLEEEMQSQFTSDKQVDKQKVVTEFLEEGDDVMLLRPNCEYALEVAYKAYLGDDNQQEKDFSKFFHFKTQDKAPYHLDSHVLGTAPFHNEAWHFYGDPIVIAFNDQTALPLFKAYNVKLKYVVKGADGKSVMPPLFDLANQPIEMLATDGGPNDIAPLSGDQEGAFASPYAETLGELAEVLPCISTDGADTTQTYLKIAAELKPLMDYTFDILPEPDDPNLPMALEPPPAAAQVPPGQPVSGDAEVPFFRRRFRTSRYADLDELAADVATTQLNHRQLTANISLGGSGAVADETLTEALMNAGEDALDAPSRNRLVLYWVPHGSGFRPHAVLIETLEPVWRERQEPKLEVVKDAVVSGQLVASDPNFKVVKVKTVADLELDHPDNMVARFLYANGGTRTLVIFDTTNPAVWPQEANQPVVAEIQVRRHGSPIYQNITSQVATLYRVPLPLDPPWDQEDEDAFI
ncbi:hypothetical protein SCOR_28530 [Sulfidibacter corallicola]|uniref:Uncharacterized protein n=1 Tax=Sulfidibacter corallicola TaxID=2818388 RepID=A0A8A4TKL9_SULCO|nr:hypothetical protein [Sulfidibacter corallicola]QTD50496.1 hypothetical protein J3U87_33345 [Sulfidibacter corallicola]